MIEFTIKNRIAHFRRKLGMTLSELADKTDVTKNAISSFERGEYCPSAFTAMLLCIALQVSFEDLFYID